MQTKHLPCEAERLSLDRISTLPQPVLETILRLLPTEDAARTSILSREWRYKWTKIPNLMFFVSKRKIKKKQRYVSKRASNIEGAKKNSDTRFKLYHDLHEVMLQRQIPIQELTLSMGNHYDYLEFDQIILNLSRNHSVKKLTLIGSDWHSSWYNLPISVFSMHNLTELNLSYFELDHPPILSVFGSLRILYLWNVSIPAQTLLHLLSNCPSLKSFGLLLAQDFDDKCTTNELFKCLPAIEHLTTWRHLSQWLVLDAVPQELPTSLIHLKELCFEEICFLQGYGLTFLLILVKCSPNLEKIKLEIDWDVSGYKKYSVVWKEYSDVWLEHLSELEIEGFNNLKPEMEFVKFILVRSPKLKKVSIQSVVDRNQESEMLKTLLQAPRVSPVVITVK
ncbi:putative F-box domain, FBD domain, leucine-rich repeat domain superfamily [Helianthus debilis subsp. tardiflorus]